MDLNMENRTDAEKILFKKRLLEVCHSILKERMENTSAQVTNAQLAANTEEKSSAGDKYETSRAMNHLEKDMYARQLQQTRTELALLMETDCTRVNTEASKGSVIHCGQLIFFIAAGIGKLQFEHKTIVVLSPFAPVGKLLAGKKAGEELVFNNQAITIQSIF
jgi:hypothetical protein